MGGACGWAKDSNAIASKTKHEANGIDRFIACLSRNERVFAGVIQ
jgi:hypothetical protein